MAGKAILATLLAGLVVGLPLAGLAAADHGGCPPFERLRYDYYVDFHHGGDLYSKLHVVGFTDFRFCLELRDRVLQEDIRFEARGGEYLVRLLGDDVEETHVLRPGQNATAWYAHDAIHTIQVVGLSKNAAPTVIVAEGPPSLLAPLRR